MKTIVILAAASLVFVGCERQDRMDDAAGTERERLDQRQESIERSAEQSQDQVDAQADAEKKRIEAQSEAEQAQLEAEKKALEAQAEADQAQREAQQDINEAAGAQPGLTAQDQGTSDADRRLAQQIRQSLTGQTAPANLSTAAKNITIIVKDGKATLKGTVQNETEKMELEQRAKAVSGVQSVDNQLEVKE